MPRPPRDPPPDRLKSLAHAAHTPVPSSRDLGTTLHFGATRRNKVSVLVHGIN